MTCLVGRTRPRAIPSSRLFQSRARLLYECGDRCMLYIMRRTQLYLDEDLWGALHARARSERTTVSELVRAAVRERYFGNRGQRMEAMQALVGIRKRASELPDAVEEVRMLRRGDRIARLTAK